MFQNDETIGPAWGGGQASRGRLAAGPREKSTAVMTVHESGRITLAVVDDHPGYAQGLKTMVESASREIEVVAVTSKPEDALGLIAETRPDVVLLDVKMPDLSGIEIARRLHDVSARTKMIMLTVSRDAQDVRDSFSAGAAGYLTKDLEVDEIISAIRLAAAGVTVLSTDSLSVLTGLAPPAAVGLTDQEIQMLELAAEGASLNEIARSVSVSRATAGRLMTQVQAKLGVVNRDQLVATAARRGWV